MVYTKRIEVEGARSLATHDFGTTDKRGRKVGAAIFTTEFDFVEDPEANGGYLMAAGHYYAFVPSATRDGNSYGATQRWTSYATVEDRDAAIATYLKGARKRAERK